MWIYVVLFLVQGVIFGIATNSVISNRGYDENWFWWGFFFGFIALIVALSKSENLPIAIIENVPNSSNVIDNGGWQCTCGKVHASYVGSCGCGRNKADVLKEIQAKKTKEIEDKKAQDELLNLQKVNEYKKMLDSGIITQEEFDSKKKQLLGL